MSKTANQQEQDKEKKCRAGLGHATNLVLVGDLLVVLGHAGGRALGCWHAKHKHRSAWLSSSPLSSIFFLFSFSSCVASSWRQHSGSVAGPPAAPAAHNSRPHRCCAALHARLTPHAPAAARRPPAPLPPSPTLTAPPVAAAARPSRPHASQPPRRPAPAAPWPLNYPASAMRAPARRRRARRAPPPLHSLVPPQETEPLGPSLLPLSVFQAPAPEEDQ